MIIPLKNFEMPEKEGLTKQAISNIPIDLKLCQHNITAYDHSIID